MNIAITSLNSAVERLLAVEANRPGSVHRLTRSETLAGGKGVNVARVLAQLAAGGHGTSTPVPAPGSSASRAAPPDGSSRICSGAEGLDSALVPTAAWGLRGARRSVGPCWGDRLQRERPTGHGARTRRAGEHVRARPGEQRCARLYGRRCRRCSSSQVAAGSPARDRGVLSVLDAHGEVLARGAAALPDVVKVNREGTPVPGARRSWGQGPGMAGLGHPLRHRHGRRRSRPRVHRGRGVRGASARGPGAQRRRIRRRLLRGARTEPARRPKAS